MSRISKTNRNILQRLVIAFKVVRASAYFISFVDTSGSLRPENKSAIFDDVLRCVDIGIQVEIISFDYRCAGFGSEH